MKDKDINYKGGYRKMKSKIRKGMALFFSAVLCIAACITVIPQMAVTVYAAGSGKNLQLTAGDISGAQEDSVYFGTYNQSGTGQSPIKWRVLQNSGSRLFLLADSNLDRKKYNDSDTSVTWETCTLRDWLNGTDAYTNNNFINTAFTETEISSIADSAVVNDDNPDYDTPGGNNTTDKIFLLSIDEARNGTYGFTDDDSRIAANTTYANNQGAYQYNGNGIWWLRSPGFRDDFAAYVYSAGYVYTAGNNVDDV